MTDADKIQAIKAKIERKYQEGEFDSMCFEELMSVFGDSPKPKRVQVIITKDFRTWDAIADTPEDALMKIFKYMFKDCEADIRELAMLLANALIRNFNAKYCTERLEEESFTVTTKEIN